MNYTFQNATFNDLEFILEGVIEINELENEQVNVEVEKDNIKNAINKSKILLCLEENIKVGFIWFSISNKCFIGLDCTPFEENYIWITTIWIKAEFRNKGIAKLLYEQVNIKAKELNIKKIWLDIYNSNNKSIEFHKKLGFIPEFTVFSLNVDNYELSHS